MTDKDPNESVKTIITVSSILCILQFSEVHPRWALNVQCSLLIVVCIASLVAGTNIAQIEEVHKVGEIELG